MYGWLGKQCAIVRFLISIFYVQKERFRHVDTCVIVAAVRPAKDVIISNADIYILFSVTFFHLLRRLILSCSESFLIAIAIPMCRACRKMFFKQTSNRAHVACRPNANAPLTNALKTRTHNTFMEETPLTHTQRRAHMMIKWGCNVLKLMYLECLSFSLPSSMPLSAFLCACAWEWFIPAFVPFKRSDFFENMSLFS